MGTLSACQTDAGHPIEPHIRQVLDQAFDTDLAAVRIKENAVAVRLAAGFGAAAFACGTDIYFAAGRYQPGRQAGLWLLAHEVAHVLQQAAGQTPDLGAAGGVSRYAVLERAASQAADQVVGGKPVQRSLRRIPLGGAARAPRPRAIQFHNSFEHRALGDLQTAELREISVAGPGRTRILEREIALQRLWQKDPESVTEEQITSQCPGITTLRLNESGLIVTYGELTALPDYIATAGAANSIPKEVLLPILQSIRQESAIKFNRLLNLPENTPFKGAIFPPSAAAPSLCDLLMSSKATDEVTGNLGLYGTDHYKAVLLRNACHFAPFSWHRWRQSYNMAITLAKLSYSEHDAHEQAHLAHAAWLQHGYAEHFLQDSFAAGHLVNKSLVMQWYVEWASGQKLTPMFDWKSIKKMTSKAQPGLGGRSLYDQNHAGLSPDPQTSEEQGSYGARLANTGLVAGDSGDLDTAYQDYFAFLSSLLPQTGSAAFHDHYNEHSLWVASVQQPVPYEIGGDDTLLSGAYGDAGVIAASEAAALSRLSLREALTTGAPDIQLTEILARFPTKVRGADNQVIGLEAWNDTQKQFCCDKIFPEMWSQAAALKVLEPGFAHNISVDQDLAVRWSANLRDASSTTASVLEVGNRLCTGSNGYLDEIDLLTGKVLTTLLLAGEAHGIGNYETRLATEGTMVFAGVHGAVHGIRVVGACQLAWSVTLPSAGDTVVNLLVDNGRLFAGSNGFVYEVDPSHGGLVKSARLGNVLGQGDYTMRLVTSGPALIAGGYGRVYGVKLATLTKSWELSLPDAGHRQVEVLVRDGQLFAGSDGRAFRIDPARGTLLDSLRLTAPGVGDYSTTLAADSHALFVGTHGYVYGIRVDDWSKPAWAANLAGDRYCVPNLVAGAGQLLAGSYGHVFRIDPASGAVLRSMMVTLGAGLADYETQLAFNSAHDEVYVGVHGHAYKLATVNV
ncbi:MAG: DUF4157 domain-containing protein [Jatrophihabitantaceae bacterium]